MNCRHVQANLSAYADEELSGAEMLEIRRHLGDCTECEEEFRCVQALKELLGAAPIPEPSNDFEERLVSNVLTHAAPDARRRSLSLFALSGIAAATMLLTLLALSAGRAGRTVAAERQENIPYEIVQRDRAFSASSEPLLGSPVMLPIDGRR